MQLDHRRAHLLAAGLTAEQMEIVALHWVDGWSIADLADLFNVAKASMQGRLERAHRRLIRAGIELPPMPKTIPHRWITLGSLQEWQLDELVTGRLKLERIEIYGEKETK